jgi:MFS family permease
LKRRELWGASLGHFASNYGYYFIVSWLPFYLVKSRGFSMGSMVAIASWAYLLNALSALAMGWLADRWIRAGRSPTTCLQGHHGGQSRRRHRLHDRHGHAAGGRFDRSAVRVRNRQRLFLPRLVRHTADPRRPRASARWVGVQNAAGNVAGLIAPAITGVLVDQTGLFDVAFALAAGVNVLGLIGWVLMLRRRSRPFSGRPTRAVAVLITSSTLTRTPWRNLRDRLQVAWDDVRS